MLPVGHEGLNLIRGAAHDVVWTPLLWGDPGQKPLQLIENLFTLLDGFTGPGLLLHGLHQCSAVG
jgi:hypothetical protein